MRKVVIGLIAVAAVALAFTCYVLVMGSGSTQAPTSSTAEDLDMPSVDANPARTGDTVVREVTKSQYVILDPQTKQISQVLGFSKLLNPGAETSRWLVEEPYIIFYDTQYECRVDSDTGTFQVDSASSNASPKDAQLSGNVKIRIKPRQGQGLSETLITMDDLTFSSERSEFATDGKVQIESDQMWLDGFGLILIFNTARGHIDYLHIRDLTELRVFNVAETGSLTTLSDSSQAVEATSVKRSSVESQISIGPETQKESSELASTSTSVSNDIRYQCTFDKNVIIRYGEELTVETDQFNIQNIIFSGVTQSTAPKEPPSNNLKSDIETETPAQMAAGNMDSSYRGRQASDRSANPETDVVVMCEGGIIFSPMPSPINEVISNAHTKAVFKSTPFMNNKIIASDFRDTVSIATDIGLLASTDAGVNPESETEKDTSLRTEIPVEPISDVPAPNPAKFQAAKIDYDLIDASGHAHGPVNFIFYQPLDSADNPDSNKPVTISADQNAQFLSDQDHRIEKIIFNKNVLAVRRSEQAGTVQLDTFHGDTLTISLDNQVGGKTDIKNIRMADGNVYAESKKIHDDQILSHVKLYCQELFYSRTESVISAAGPGKIEMDNSRSLMLQTSDSGFDLQQPCYVYCEGFNDILWNLQQQTILAQGRHDVMQIVYIPLREGLPEKFVFINSSQFDLNFATVADQDTTMVKRIFTDQGIVYREENNDRTQTLHTIVGQTLEYDQQSTEGWVKITGTEAVPVNVDGSRLKEVFVNPQTGEMKASLSKTPGIFGR